MMKIMELLIKYNESANFYHTISLYFYNVSAQMCLFKFFLNTNYEINFTFNLFCWKKYKRMTSENIFSF